MKVVHKNSLVSNEKVTDLAGNLVYLTNHGERVLGTDFNTGEELEELDKVISTDVVCNLCGIPFDKKKKICKTVGQKVYCKDCIDQVNPRGK